VALPFFLCHKSIKRWVVGIGLGVSLAMLVSANTSRIDLVTRIVDLVESQGTAEGRLYLWRIYLKSFSDIPLVGTGPEGFQRIWPDLQSQFLSENPRWAPFRSDIRHAHNDLFEVWVDFGVVGVMIILFLVALIVRRGTGRVPELGTLVGGMAGCLGSSLLSFSPTLVILAIALGLRLGPMRNRGQATHWMLIAGLLFALVLLTLRIASEVIRCDATQTRMKSDMHQALQYSRQAVRIDGRNPRAWIELSIACHTVGDYACAQTALRRAMLDLPTDSVRESLAALKKLTSNK
jgi:O-antigen ligase